MDDAGSRRAMTQHTNATRGPSPTSPMRTDVTMEGDDQGFYVFAPKPGRMLARRRTGKLAGDVNVAAGDDDEAGDRLHEHDRRGQVGARPAARDATRAPPCGACPGARTRRAASLEQRRRAVAVDGNGSFPSAVAIRYHARERGATPARSARGATAWPGARAEGRHPRCLHGS